MDTATNLEPTTSTTTTSTSPARWAAWGCLAGALGLAGNLVAAHGTLKNADAAAAVASVDRAAYHVGTLAGLGAFVSLLLLAGGWRRWAGQHGGIAEQAIPTALTVSAALVLFGTGMRGGLSEYLPGGINDDNFDDAGLYGLFIVHDTAPWFAWWGVVVAAALVAYLSFRVRTVPLWLGVVSAVAVVPPLAVAAGSGAVAGAGLIGPIWLVVVSLVVAVRGLPGPRGE